MRYADLPDIDTSCKVCGRKRNTVPLTEASLAARKLYGSFGHICKSCESAQYVAGKRTTGPLSTIGKASGCLHKENQ